MIKRPVVAAALASLLLAAPGARAACLSDEQVRALHEAYSARRPAANPSGLSMADGECSRAKLLALMNAQLGPSVGYKAGLTNAAVQKRFNHDAPVWGALYAPMLLQSGASVDAAFGARPLFEADLLVRVASPAINQARDPMAVLESIDQVIPFIELPDLVVQAPPQLDGAAIVAINVGARLGVTGTPIAVPPYRAERYQLVAALREMNPVVRVDGAEVDRGRGADVLDHPLNAVVWLVQDLARQGRALKAGELLSLGSFSKLLPPRAGQSVEVQYLGLPGDPVVRVGFR